MRPTRLEVEGFTAFRDPTTVDFEGADLFALTGPTGSGKTSILDAMVFALYGTVPRLADQRQVAPVIAQGMAEARVRLDFTVGADAFTATRIVRRTKAGASTAEARLETEGEVLAGNADEVTAAIGELLGLTFEQFTKCVVLPQGEFARFLHDKPSVRQDLLISLLDLGVYAEMADRAGKRASSAKNETAVLEARLGDVAAATPEAIKAAAQRVTRLERLLVELETAAPELAALDGEEDIAADQLARYSEEAELLGEIVVPKGLAKVHEQVTLASKAVDVATEAVTKADARVSSAGDRTELARWADAHVRLATLTERREKANTLTAERSTDVAAAAEALSGAAHKLEAARATAEDVAAAHRAHAVRADLVAGEDCPVCQQLVAQVPNVKAPPALDKARVALDKAGREHQIASQAHAAAAQSLAVAEEKLVGLDDDLVEVQVLVKDAPDAAEVKRRLELHSTATVERDEANAALAAAQQDHVRAVDAESQARHAYDDAREWVAASKPPARRRSATLLDEWSALTDWAATEMATRLKAAKELEKQTATISTRRTKLLTALAKKCADAELELTHRAGAEPAAAAGQALGRATAEHDSLVARAADADRLRTQLADVEARGALARGLATHLDARHFEKWLLDEAMAELADGATELLLSLSGGQYSLRVDGKTGNFVVVDHRNADERRGARTLSGGETFLASLALALALADRIASLAARGVARLESIFLDEGFGTLDPDTLDVVASAIEELGASGRMVGVVSHVAELAERLPVRYEVRRAANAATVERVDQLMHVAIDAWDPGYGSGASDARELMPSDVPTDPSAEVPLAQWKAIRPDETEPWKAVVFIDGVQRIDARAWVTDDRGDTRQGLCVSVAAGAVRCNAVADVLDVVVDRALVSPVEGADHLNTRHGVWRHVMVADDEIEVLDGAIGRLRSSLEASLAQRVAQNGDQIVVDGPLSQHRHMAGALGYVKTLQRGYGPAEVLQLAAQLEPGERTPMLVVGDAVARWSWYVRLPGAIAHPLAGIVRCETSGDLKLDAAAALADKSARSLPRFASAPHKDTRAPQNLYPIAGLERSLRRRLGDQGLLLHALRQAAA